MNNEIARIIADTLGISDSAAAILALKSNKQELASNSVLYYQDDPSTHLHIVVSGYVRLSYISEDGFVTLLAIVPPGRSFGESGLLEGLMHCDTSSTAGKTEILTIPANFIKDNSAVGHETEAALARVLARRYRSHLAFTRGLYLPNLRLRLSNILLSLLKDLGNHIRYRGGMHDCLGPVVSQRDLGSMARGTRENVNKTLRSWENDDIIALEDRHIIIMDKDALEDIANGL